MFAPRSTSGAVLTVAERNFVSISRPPLCSALYSARTFTYAYVVAFLLGKYPTPNFQGAVLGRFATSCGAAVLSGCVRTARTRRCGNLWGEQGEKQLYRPSVDPILVLVSVFWRLDCPLRKVEACEPRFLIKNSIASQKTGQKSRLISHHIAQTLSERSDLSLRSIRLSERRCFSDTTLARVSPHPACAALLRRPCLTAALLRREAGMACAADFLFYKWPQLQRTRRQPRGAAPHGRSSSSRTARTIWETAR